MRENGNDVRWLGSELPEASFRDGPNFAVPGGTYHRQALGTLIYSRNILDKKTLYET